ncbi:MAG: ACT domain-containing protein [Bacillota bacterium]|nr:ACT domain-containing protein [Bacillota bacterium]
MILKEIDGEFSILKVNDLKDFDLNSDFYFIARTDEELSVVCRTENAPKPKIKEDGFKAFRIDEVLDFSLIGILAQISKVLSDNKIGIFAVSTFNTDYIMVRKEQFNKASAALKEAGYEWRSLNECDNL